MPTEWDAAYRQGTTDEKLRAIMDRLERVEAKVDDVNNFRHHMLGVATIISVVVAAIVQFVLRKV